GVGGIDGDTRRRGDADVGAVLRDVDGELRPALPRVGRAIDAGRAGRAGAGERHVGVGGIDGDAPHHRAVHGRVEAVPAAAAVVARVEALIGTRVHVAGAPRVGGQRLDDTVGVHPLSNAGARPGLPVVAPP